MPRFDVLDIANDIDYATLSVKDVLLFSPGLCLSRSPSPGQLTFYSEVLQSTKSPCFFKSKSISSSALDSFINAPFSATPSPLRLGYTGQPSPSSQISLSFPEMTRLSLSPFSGLDFEKAYEFSPPSATQPQQRAHTWHSASNSPLLESPVVRRSLGDVTPPFQTLLSQRPCKRPKQKTTTTTTKTTTATTATTTTITTAPEPEPESITTRKTPFVRQDTPDQRQPTPTLLTHSLMTSDTPFIDRLRQTTGKLFPASFSPIRRSPSYNQLIPLRSPFASDTNVLEHNSASGATATASAATPSRKPYFHFYDSPLTDPDSESPRSSRSTSVSATELPRCADSNRRVSARHHQTEKLGPDATCAAVLKTIKRPLSNDDISAKQHQAKKRKQNPTTKSSSNSIVINIENTENIAQPHFDIQTSRRTFPSNIPIQEEFLAFYRQFPIISFFYPKGATTSVVATRTTKRPPSGFTMNEPRSAYDLYTPRFTKGVGINKVGLCPLCFEPKSRGGNGSIEWFAMKVSAYKYYHLQYVHGVSSFTGAPFSPPIAFRVSKRRPAEIRKHEKTELLHGKCHKCDKWVPIEGVKIGEVKVKELYWWKHAASCHKSTTIPGEADIYIRDNVYDKLMEYEKSLTSQN